MGAFDRSHAAHIVDLFFSEPGVAGEDEFSVRLLECGVIEYANPVARTLPAGIGNVVDQVLLYVRQSTGKHRVVQAL